MSINEICVAIIADKNFVSDAKNVRRKGFCTQESYAFGSVTVIVAVWFKSQNGFRWNVDAREVDFIKAIDPIRPNVEPKRRGTHGIRYLRSFRTDKLKARISSVFWKINSDDCIFCIVDCQYDDSRWHSKLFTLERTSRIFPLGQRKTPSLSIYSQSWAIIVIPKDQNWTEVIISAWTSYMNDNAGVRCYLHI